MDIPTSPVASDNPPAPQPVLAPERPVFTGNAGEFFRIWIVNLLLTIATLGIYAAWAKVRTKRYFHANTLLFGEPFDFTANPRRILIGQLLVVGFFLLHGIASELIPIVAFVLLVAFTFIFPWLIIKAAAFNARNTVWKGLRFGFHGRYGKAFAIYVLGGLAAVLSLGLLIPWLSRARRKFLFDHYGYGTARFSFDGSVRAFYILYGKALLCFLPAVVAWFVFFGTLVAGVNTPGDSLPAPAIGALILLFPALLLALFARYFIEARMFNLYWNHTRIGPHRISADMNIPALMSISMVNSIMVLVTVGLMIPWARVRMAEFKLSCLTILPGGHLDEFVAAAQPTGSATGDAAADFFDFDIGF